MVLNDFLPLSPIASSRINSQDEKDLNELNNLWNLETTDLKNKNNSKTDTIYNIR